MRFFILLTLSALVILTVLAVLAANLGFFGSDVALSTLAKWGPAGVLAEIVALYVFVAKTVFAKCPSPSLLIGPPEKMKQLDVTKILWDDNGCLLRTSAGKQCPIRLVPSRNGPSFRVQLAAEHRAAINGEESIALELRDRKGNTWYVTNFYPWENLVPLAMPEDMNKVIRDYGEPGQ